MTDTTEQALVEMPAPDAIAPEQPETEVEVQAESSPAVNDSDETEAPRPKGVQKRIDELTRNWREAERREAQLMAMLQRQNTPKPEPVKAEPVKEPTLEDFNYDEAAYRAALMKHASAEAARLVREELRREEEQRKQSERSKSWKTREAEFKAKHPDYEEVAHYAPISDAMADLIMDSEIGTELAYWLGKNPDKAEEIAQMSEREAARAIGRLEAKLEKPPAPPPPKPVPAVSKAPPPPPRIEATEPAVERDPDQMNVKDWLKWREKQLSKRK